MTVGRIEFSPSVASARSVAAGEMRPVPRLTDAERSACRMARTSASHETDELLNIIERLAGERIVPLDEPTPDPFAFFDRNGYPSEP